MKTAAFSLQQSEMNFLYEMNNLQQSWNELYLAMYNLKLMQFSLL